MTSPASYDGVRLIASSYKDDGAMAASKVMTVDLTAGRNTFTVTGLRTGARYLAFLTDLSGRPLCPKITFEPEPAALTVKTHPAGAEVYSGENTVLTVAAEGGKTPYSYQWYKDGAAISGASAASCSAEQAGSYHCVVTDARGRTAESKKATVTLLAALRIESQSNSAEVDEGESALLTVTAAGGKQPYTYQWFRGSAAISGASAASCSAEQAGSYHCVVTGANGRKVDSAEIQVTVIPKLRFTMQPSGAVIDHGSVASLQVAATGGKGAYAYRWYKDGVAISGAASSAYTATQSGVYYCRASDSIGASDESRKAFVTVGSALHLTHQPEDQVAYADDKYSGSMYDSLNGGTEPYSFQWYLDGEPFLGEEARKNCYYAKASGVYCCFVQDSAGKSVLSDEATVTVVPRIQFARHPRGGVIAEGGSLTLSVEVEGGTGEYLFNWLKDGQELGIWTTEYVVTQPGSYVCRVCYVYPGTTRVVKLISSEPVRVYSAAGMLRIVEQPRSIYGAPGDFMAGANIQLHVSATSASMPLTYKWQVLDQNGTAWTDIEGATEAYYIPEENGSYRVYVSDGIGDVVISDPASVDIAVWPLMIVQQPTDTPMFHYDQHAYYWGDYPLDFVFKGGSGRYRYTIEVSDGEGVEFCKAYGPVLSNDTALHYKIYTSTDDDWPFGSAYDLSRAAAHGDGWALWSGYGLYINKEGVRYRIVVEDDADPSQRLVSRVCKTADYENLTRGETLMSQVVITYDSIKDEAVLSIYGGSGVYTVLWQYAWSEYVSLHTGWRYGDWNVLPENSEMTRELTSFGEVIRYPHLSQKIHMTSNVCLMATVYESVTGDPTKLHDGVWLRYYLHY